LKKRTSINSIPKIHKEKEMADFRKCFYALAVVALLAGLTIPASAQGVTTCTNAGSVNAPVRAQGYAELVGDVYLSCTGGTSTPPGQIVQPVNIQVTLNTNITSKLLGTASLGFDEALLIIDDPNTAGNNSNRPILNCGSSSAPDQLIGSGPGVCEIVATAPAGQLTYDGTPNGSYNATNGNTTCGTTPAPAVNSYGCGRPNVFQGRQGTPQNPGQANSIYFLGVPFDPPATGQTRTLRITNIRADAEQFGIVTTFLQQSITETITVSGNSLLTIVTPTLTVGTVQTGLLPYTSTNAANTRLNFIQCNTENGGLFAGTTGTGGVATSTTTTCGGTKGGSCNGTPTLTGTFGIYNQTPVVRIQEGFASSWKEKNLAQIIGSTTGSGGNGTYTAGVGYVYNGGTAYPSDLNQNVPGVNYNTESGFEYISSGATPNPNPPLGFGTTAVTGGTQTPFSSINGTGIAGAGQASQGTRLALSFANVPAGSSIWVPPVVYLYRQNSATIPTPAMNVAPNTSGLITGVAVLATGTDASGNGAFTPPTSLTTLQQVSSSNLVVYEVLFDDPSSLEQVDVPVVVAYAANLTSNPPTGLPATGTVTTVATGFAPFYSTSTAKQPSSTLPVPRFIPGSGPLNLFNINKCACNLLFPYVVSTLGYDTGIAIANTSTDPGATAGFDSTGPQQGAVQLWYYGQGANGTAPPATQTSSVVPSGQVLTYVLSTGNSGQGLDNRGAGFIGYIIAQAQFQYCHGFAFIGALGGGPTSQGISEGYLAIVLDNTSALPRTLQAGENDGH
jgi:hypothetical protein